MQRTPMLRMLTHITAMYDVRPTRLVGVSVGSALVATRIASPACHLRSARRFPDTLAEDLADPLRQQHRHVRQRLSVRAFGRSACTAVSVRECVSVCVRAPLGSLARKQE